MMISLLIFSVIKTGGIKLYGGGHCKEGFKT